MNISIYVLKSKIRKMEGFTFVELMITITIIAILLAIAIPSLSAFINNNRVSTSINEFVGTVALARSEAIKQGRLVTVCRSANATSATPTCDSGATDWASGWLTYVESSTTTNVGTYEAAEVILARKAALPNILIPASVASITFNSSGQPISTATTTFNFSYKNLYPREVCMERTGRVKTIRDGNSGSC
ncbi:GspH/FimT family pseudopilin [Undibacterium sp. Ren11W]|uniref:GspH/FimT family pseudopilin n=1 Tax=Undibacterium sp. Ren11W TaxID=3413045 RepID=UPI003BEFA54F